MTLLARRLAWQNLNREPPTPDLRVLLLSTFTVEPLAPYLGTALAGFGFVPSVEVGPFDQIEQTLLAGDGADVDIVVIWPRLEDLHSGPAPLVDGDDDAMFDGLLTLGTLAAQRGAAWSATIVFVLPTVPSIRPLGVGDAGNRFGVAASTARAREAVRAAVAGQPGVLVYDADDVVRLLGERGAMDDRRLAAAHIPYTEAAFAQVGDGLANLVRLSRRGARKVAVLDADNTLWGGVVGEEGATGVDLADQGPGVAYRAFQRYLLDLRRSGMLLAVASKNNEADALEVFERPEMELGVEDLATWRIDWNPKSGNIEAMADELNLGVASMVFIDDSAHELAEVASRLPTVAGLQMPEDPAGWVDSIARSGVLDRLAPTTSDLGRAASYATETKRRTVAATTDLQSFLASLNLRVRIFEPSNQDLPRLAQLIAKTNQFTFGGPRPTEAELARVVQERTKQVALVSAVDDFGDYGVVGAVIVGPSASDVGPRFVVESFVLSCRAMGRGIEDAMLARAQALAGGDLGVLAFRDAKNAPAWAFLGRVGVRDEGVSTPQPLGWPPHITPL